MPRFEKRFTPKDSGPITSDVQAARIGEKRYEEAVLKLGDFFFNNRDHEYTSGELKKAKVISNMIDAGPRLGELVSMGLIIAKGELGVNIGENRRRWSFNPDCPENVLKMFEGVDNIDT